MAELEQSEIDQSEIDIAPLVTRAPTSRRLMELMRAPEAKPPAVRRVLRKRDQGNAHLLRDRCQKLCLSIFYREQAPARTLGFTSALAGEGKTFLAMMVATVLAGDSGVPVTLLECNWEHPTLHEHFDLPRTPGLAEWLRGEAVAAQVRHQVGDNLFVVPAGDGRRGRATAAHDARARRAGPSRRAGRLPGSGPAAGDGGSLRGAGGGPDGRGDPGGARWRHAGPVHPGGRRRSSAQCASRVWCSTRSRAASPAGCASCCSAGVTRRRRRVSSYIRTHRRLAPVRDGGLERPPAPRRGCNRRLAGLRGQRIRRTSSNRINRRPVRQYA